jgi:formate hydrogenlyase subunit 6/NADH:ubiquinone oxidoreductase subunit I
MSIDNGTKCFGCRICENLCPVGAITFQVNKRGFGYPEVNHEKCIECGICEKPVV